MDWLKLWGTAMENNYKTTGTQSTDQSKRRILSQEAVDKLIYNTMSSDQGLAALASGENLSGGFNSATKTLMAQDLATKLIGELALVTAEEVSTADTQTAGEKNTKEGRFLNKFADTAGTVICTELARQGYLDPELYEAGGPPSRQVSYHTWVGYHIWAIRVVSAMQKSPALCYALLPIVQSRYEFLTGRNRIAILGRLSVYLGHPICNLIGRIVTLGGKYGRSEEFA